MKAKVEGFPAMKAKVQDCAAMKSASEGLQTQSEATKDYEHW